MKNITLVPLLAATLLLSAPSIFAGEIKLENPGFEKGLTGWTVPKADKGKSKVQSKAAHRGNSCLEVTDDISEEGSELFSQLFPAVSGRTYKVSFWGRNLAGEGMGVYLVFYNSERQPINADIQAFTIPGVKGEWKQFSHEKQAPAGAEFVAIRLHSYSLASVTAQLDDFTLTEDR